MESKHDPIIIHISYGDDGSIEIKHNLNPMLLELDDEHSTIVDLDDASYLSREALLFLKDMLDTKESFEDMIEQQPWFKDNIIEFKRKK